MATRTPRPDGNTTRLHILETAGQLFAAQGFAQTTSKEICTRAGTNMAAINYHFGGRDGLYEAVLIEAHKQLVSLDELMALSQVSNDPRLKLQAFLTHMVEMSAQPKAPWGFRVVLREALSPSSALPVLIQRAVLPKAKLLRASSARSWACLTTTPRCSAACCSRCCRAWCSRWRRRT
ncbi:TetR/AcrR family transcriptional regulator [Variovorax sp. E3]|uniref:TetR/AcrR family transcriptional regulator n=1 Tax=Variovorax sp. E3 TaxID=1914993 RepID=UPI0022B66601|nr:TetR family transcriptional regulator [Variovorax sp. E3]